MPSSLHIDDSQLRTRLHVLRVATPPVMAQALTTVANEVMTESKRQVPVDTGVLRASGYVGSPKGAGASMSIEVGYGGPAEQYAVRVHEDLAAHHAEGNAKYLERPLSNSKSIRGRILAEIKRGLGL